MQSTYLGKLQKGRHKGSVCVRVMRKWIFKENMGEGPPLYVGLVLADARADAMYAEIPQDVITSKEPLVQVDKTYLVSRFKVNNARPTYKPFDAQLMIEFTDFTSVVLAKSPAATFPAYIYSLSPFDKITPSEGPVAKYTDVIGYITKYTSLSSIVPRGKEKASILREVFIKDMSDNELKVTLWGNHATKFTINHLYSEAAPNVVVGLFVGCMPRKIFNKPYVSGGTACEYYLNPDVKEAQPFYSRFKDQPVYIERPAPSEDRLPEQVQVTPLQHKDLADLNSMDPFDFADEGYKCTVTVTSIADNNWWYMSCGQCKKKTDPQPGGRYKCPKCHSATTLPRYILTFAAKDSTAEASFFAYDEIARQIVQKECNVILNPLKLAVALPQPLQAVISKKFVFSIGLTEDSYTSRARRQYLINSILDRSDRRTSALNISTSETAGQIVPNPMNNPTVPVTSVDTMQNPPPESQLLSIDCEIQTTPTPAPDVDETPLKDLIPGSSTAAAHARRRLFSDNADADQETTDDKGLNTTVVIQDDKDGGPRSSLQRKPKRIKGTASTHQPEDPTARASLPETPK